MVGSRSEQSGIIKDGAKLVNAVANSWSQITITEATLEGRQYPCASKLISRFFMHGLRPYCVMGGDQAPKNCCKYRWQFKSTRRCFTAKKKNKIVNEINEVSKQTSPLGTARSG